MNIDIPLNDGSGRIALVLSPLQFIFIASVLANLPMDQVLPMTQEFASSNRKTMRFVEENGLNMYMEISDFRLIWSGMYDKLSFVSDENA